MMSEKAAVVTHIEGNLLQDDDDESSASESDGGVYDPPIASEVEFDNSDEELEVFTSEKNLEPAKSIVAATPPDTDISTSTLQIDIIDDKHGSEDRVASSQGEEKSLVTIMGAITDAITKEVGNGSHATAAAQTAPDAISGPRNLQVGAASAVAAFGMSAPSAPKALDTVYSTAVSSSRDDDNPSSTDAFGIAYRPYRKPKPSYSLPTGPAFEDEVEFEREMLQQQPQQQIREGSGGRDVGDEVGGAEDEFDFEDVTAVAAFQSSLQQREAAGGTRTDDEPADTDNHDKTGEESVKNERPSMGSTEKDSEPTVAVREAARVALAEITGVYSSGLGDHEVTILQASAASVSGSSVTACGLGVGMGGGAIEEVDEEEVERQEEEEDRRKINALDQEQKRARELQSVWDAVERSAAVAPLLKKCSDGANTSKSPSGRDFMPLKYKVAESLMREQDMSRFRPLVVLNDRDQSWSLLSSNIKLSKASIPAAELELPFLIAQVDYNPDDVTHFSILRSIYQILVVSNGGGSAMCPKQGAHWEAVGFQGSDPRTDLNRSMKMLSVLQMLHLIEKEPGMAQRLYANSLGTGGVLPSPTGAAGDVASIDDSWPLMCVGIGMTKHAIDALRSGALTKDVNKANSCMAVLHEFHHACFYCFLRLLTESPHLHHAVHLAAIRKEVSGDPRGMLRAFRNFKFPKPDNEGETHQKESSYDDIEEDRQESSGEIMGSKKSWFSGFGQSKASKFVVDAEK